ncbi:PliI family lysozyme inhibitor of I-type lysozyme [Xenorhabdus anantnagensis]|uniref:PliI family lysozyme inhibitor of I-type lysozyme n=1 Tax=Xenorhabdus anantnagensis TaxID=3025875 RepID=A0ABT5LMF5_9GAMM|nr:PliI family lysozyme inhibitor of I-type lysozyme [Xenorhabdus anantnagensis]MDC9595597.1 PliI family lysozyme inhibitor of I-type lysozyme [Xenorhabdus anantnagensis]
MRINNILKTIAIPTLITLLLSAPAGAREGKLINLPDKRFAVLSTGDLESASIGSYSIAIFKDKDLTDFVTGAVFKRDGSVLEDNGNPRITFADINGDGSKELIVSKLTAGSGNYLEVDALKITPKNIKLLTRIHINGNNDPIKSLRTICKREACIEQKH